MRSNITNLTDLFDQLGLDSKDAAIQQFIREHQLAGGQDMVKAKLWTRSHAGFIQEA